MSPHLRARRREPILVAVAWPYANGPRHIGHVAGFGVPADIYARYHRLAGNDVLMVSGTDEHGTPITVEAEKLGTRPPRVRRPQQRHHRQRSAASGAHLRPVHPHHDGQPLRRGAGPLRDPLRQRRHHQADGTRRLRRRHRPRPARPLHRGHLPHLRLRDRPGATSATTAATSSTRPTSSTRGRGSTASRPSSARPSTSSWSWASSPSGCTSGSAPATGGPTCAPSR